MVKLINSIFSEKELNMTLEELIKRHNADEETITNYDPAISIQFLPDDDFEKHPLETNFDPLRHSEEAANDYKNFPYLKPEPPSVYNVSNIVDKIDEINTDDLSVEVDFDNKTIKTIYNDPKLQDETKETNLIENKTQENKNQKTKILQRKEKYLMYILYFITAILLGNLLGKYLIHLIWDKML